jgi:hypothetical protein
MKKKILLIVATHGDEKIGIEVVQNLKKLKDYFDVLIANPKALKAEKRFIDNDLNRSYLGNRYSASYEEQRACKNFQVAKKYQFVIDLHEASSGRDDFVIIPRDRAGEKFPLSWIGLNKVLLWPFPRGPIGQFLDGSIELEFGMKDRERAAVVGKATKIVGDFIAVITEQKVLRETKKDWFYVYGEKSLKEIKNIDQYLDFEKTKINNEEFYPLLVGQYAKEGIAFYKMKKLD